MTEHGTETIERRVANLIADTTRICTEPEQRRDVLLERAAAAGVDRGAAERAHEVAVEEGLDPALGLALLSQGVSVRDFHEPLPEAHAIEADAPEWIDAPPSPADAGQERRLRETFRRLRSLMDREGDARRAIAAFVREPDLEPYDY